MMMRTVTVRIFIEKISPIVAKVVICDFNQLFAAPLNAVGTTSFRHLRREKNEWH